MTLSLPPTGGMNCRTFTLPCHQRRWITPDSSGATPAGATAGVPDALFAPESGAGVWGGEALLPGMSPLAQVYSGHQFGTGPASWATDAGSCSASSSWRMAAVTTGI